MATIGVSQLPEISRPLLSPTSEGRARFTREAYQRMFEAGIFANSPRVELLDGEIVVMSPIGPEHVALISLLTEFFSRHLPESMQCRVQAPVVLGDDSEPEPDLAIVVRRADSYRTQHPTATDILLLIEVAQSSLGRDLDWKRRIYAASGVEYWVVDADDPKIVVHRDPSQEDYRSVNSFGLDHSVSPLAAPDCQLAIDWLF